MTVEHARFHSVDGKRRLLVVEDEQINREILGAILKDDYDLLFAEDGAQALDTIRRNANLLSLILLDLIMPNMSGQEVLQQIKADPNTKDIPVIVVTADHSQEIECLDAGASDFISKPYPDAGVIKARIRRNIELSEDRQILESTERDPLTGLYNREFFYSYARQYDQFHADQEMDAIVLDINHFSILNERYGRAYADDVLRRVGEKAREMVKDAGGIVCRREGDIFYVYCPHREDYKAILDNASQGLAGEQTANSRVRLRMGVYSKVDKTLDIERRFDRAKMASDTVRGSFTRNIGIYDDTLRKSELYEAQLIDDFQTALAEHQFLVYYQPKFDIRIAQPRLHSAEALVRWNHPELGMISPGVFIPLFEDNGMIQDLDHYVWEEAARQVREWKDTYGICVPVSVNVSRIDMYDPNIVFTLMRILEKHSLDAGDLHLEVTESAYAEDAEQIAETVKRLRAIGFAIEMDDFGTGYSSLNMLNTLPIDALKLDMIFIRSAFAEDQNTRMLEIMVEIADNLSVPVIAEGVEEKDQLEALRRIGCDIVQGYYFSPPLPADQFAPYLEELRDLRDHAKAVQSGRKRAGKRGAADGKAAAGAAGKTGKAGAAGASGALGAAGAAGALAVAGTAGTAGTAGVGAAAGAGAAVGAGALGAMGTAGMAGAASDDEGDAARQTPSLAERWSQKFNIPLSGASAVFVLTAILVAICLFMSNIMVTRGYMEIEQANENYIHAEQSTTDLQMASDYLTEQVRLFVVTGDIENLENYFHELEVDQRRETAVTKMRDLLQGTGTAAYVHLSAALRLSNELVDYEYHAMKLRLADGDYDTSKIPAVLQDYKLSADERALSSEEKLALASELVLGADYIDYKARIKENTDACAEFLIDTSGQLRAQADQKMDHLLTIQTIIIVVLLLIVLAIVLFITIWVRNPLSRMVLLMKARETVPPTGAGELRFVSETYNAIFEENRRTHQRLSYGNMHDSLTGLYNRKAYDVMCQDIDMSNNALILVDVDKFKTINDTYGHDVGDRVLKRVSEVLTYSFRSTDLVFRLGGDEFVVIMTQADRSMGDAVRSKIDQANVMLQKPTHDLPPTSLSVGVAFADRENPDGDIFKDADTALYRVKEAGRCGCYIY